MEILVYIQLAKKESTSLLAQPGVVLAQKRSFLPNRPGFPG
jgi:hypothetical protein